MDLCISPNPESSLMPLLVSCGKAEWCWRENPATSSHSPTEILHLSFCSTPTCRDYGSFFKIPISLFFIGTKITSRLSYVISHVRIPFMLWTPITEAERRVGPVQEPSQVAKVSRLESHCENFRWETDHDCSWYHIDNSVKKQGKKLGGFASHPNTTGRTALFSHLHYALTWPLLKASVLPPRIHHRCP